MESSSATPKGDEAVHNRRQFLTDIFHLVSAGISGAILATIDDVKHGGPRTTRDRRSRRNRKDMSRDRSDFERFILPNGVYTGLMLLLIKEAREALKLLTTIPRAKKR